jgi:hypothetical protein
MEDEINIVPFAERFVLKYSGFGIGNQEHMENLTQRETSNRAASFTGPSILALGLLLSIGAWGEVKAAETDSTTVTKIDSSVFESVNKQVEAKSHTEESLNGIFAGLPGSLLNCQLLSKQPKVVSAANGDVDVLWTFAASYKLADYYGKVLPAMEEAFSKAAKRKGVEVATQTRMSPFYAKAVGTGPIWKDPKMRFPAYDHKSEVLVLLNVGRNERGDNLRWNWYLLDRSTHASILADSWFKRYKLKVTFLGKNAQILREEELKINSVEGGKTGAHWAQNLDHSMVVSGWRPFPSFLVPKRPGDLMEREVAIFLDGMPGFYKTQLRGEAARAIDAYVISPVFKFDAPNCADNCYTDQVTIPYQAKFTLSEVKEISEIRSALIVYEEEGI